MKGAGLHTIQLSLVIQPRSRGKQFLLRALPGETVRAKITHSNKRLEEAECLEVLGEPSALQGCITVSALSALRWL